MRQIQFPFLPGEHVEAEALGLLTRTFGVPSVPIDLDAVIFDCLAEQDGLSFNNEQILGSIDGDRILGRMLPYQGRIEICKRVWEEGPLGRYRFTVAHEIGHWVLHRALCLQSDSTLDLFELEEGPSELISLNRNVFPTGGERIPREEYQANLFAGYLLIPSDALRTEFEQRYGEPPICTPAGLSVAETARSLASAKHPDGTCLHETFGVSAQAMGIALSSRGYVTDEPLAI